MIQVQISQIATVPEVLGCMYKFIYNGMHSNITIIYGSIRTSYFCLLTKNTLSCMQQRGGADNEQSSVMHTSIAIS